MNIFILDRDPYAAAACQCDVHVRKMIVESAQLLSAADVLFYQREREERYRLTHRNHPCTRSLSDRNNYLWLCSHLEGLLNEFEYRWRRPHRTRLVFDRYFREFAGGAPGEITFPPVMPEEFKIENDLVGSYRNYYRYKALVLPRFHYTGRNRPDFLDEPMRKSEVQ